MELKKPCEIRDHLEEKTRNKLSEFLHEDTALITLPFASGKFGEQQRKRQQAMEEYEKAQNEWINHRLNDNC